MGMSATLLLIVGIPPLVAVAGALLSGSDRFAERLNLLASIVSFGAAVLLPADTMGATHILWQHYFVLDPLAAWVVLCVAAVYLLASIYAVGYMRAGEHEGTLAHFYALFAAFAFTMFVAPVMNSPGLYWIAIELTTLVSTFLVGFERSAEAMEAAWKYIIVVSAGITLALLGTVFFYWAGTFVLGARYDLTWSTLLQAAPKMEGHLTLLAFLLTLVGYGTKVGLAPMHTWLPDAHSEGPTPVSAMLSGALLNTAMVGIVRALRIADAAGVGFAAHTLLIVLGIFSFFVAALFIVRQSGIKRLMAYSSVEHMGVVALGFGFGGVLGVAAALYHMLNHSLTKSGLFFGAGNVMRVYGSKEIPTIRRVLSFTPVSGLVWLAGAVAITGAPPFGLFLSEFAALRAGWRTPNAWAAWTMVLLLVVVFAGFLNHFRMMYFEGEAPDRPRASLSQWCLWPLWLAVLPVLVLGVWWPDAFWQFFVSAAHSLAMGSGP